MELALYLRQPKILLLSNRVIRYNAWIKNVGVIAIG